MAKTPLVSVILPSYNHVRFIRRAVESVLDQDVRDLELIVVDDGSVDGTPDVVDEIKDPRVQLVRLSANRLRHPRNLALGLATGMYVAFQNSDDVWLAGKLRKQLEMLEQDTNTLVCFTDVQVIDEEGATLFASWANGLFVTENRNNMAWLRRFFERGNCLCCTSAVVRHDGLQKVGGFRGSLIQLSDFDLWVRLAAIGQFEIIPEQLTCFRVVGEKSATNLTLGRRQKLMSALVGLLGIQRSKERNLSAPEFGS